MNKQKKLCLYFSVNEEIFLYSQLTIPYLLAKKNNLKVGELVRIINNTDLEDLGQFIIYKLSYNPFKKKLHVRTNRLPPKSNGSNFQEYTDVEVFKI